MAGQPKPRTSELMQALNALSHKDRSNVFQLKMLESEARKVQAVDAADGYTLLGALAAVRGDVDAVKANHERALRLAPGDVYFIQNFAISLMRVGAYEDGIGQARRLFSMDKSTKSAMLLVEILGLTGRLQEADKILSENFEPKQLDIEAQSNTAISGIRGAAWLLAEREVTDVTTHRIVQGGYEIAPRLSIVGTKAVATSDSEDSWVDYALVVDADAASIGEMNSKFAERMAEMSLDEPVSKAGSSFVVRFTSIENYKNNDGSSMV
jgi:hypothetical protein